MAKITDKNTSIGKRARSILFSSYSKLMLATLFFVAMSVGLAYIGGAFGALLYDTVSEKTSSLVSVTLMLCSIIISVPLYLGYITLIIRASSGEECSLADLFYYYSSRSLCLSAYRVFLKLFPYFLFSIYIPTVLLPMGLPMIEEFNYLFQDAYIGFMLEASVKFGYYVLWIIIAVISYYCLGIITARIFTACANDGEIKKPRYSGFKFIKLRLSMIPLIIVSVLSFGILFIIYTIPYVVISYSLLLGLCDKKKDTDSEEGEKRKTKVFTRTEAKTVVFQNASYNTFADTTIFTSTNNGENADKN